MPSNDKHYFDLTIYQLNKSLCSTIYTFQRGQPYVYKKYFLKNIHTYLQNNYIDESNIYILLKHSLILPANIHSFEKILGNKFDSFGHLISNCIINNNDLHYLYESFFDNYYGFIVYNIHLIKIICQYTLVDDNKFINWLIECNYFNNIVLNHDNIEDYLYIYSRYANINTQLKNIMLNLLIPTKVNINNEYHNITIKLNETTNKLNEITNKLNTIEKNTTKDIKKRIPDDYILV